MVRRGDERAVTMQIGAVLLLAIFVAALALYQVQAVPVQNERVEISHNDAVKDELVDLRDVLRASTVADTSASTSVTLGIQYHDRIVAINPPHPVGTLQTEPAEHNLTIEGDDVNDLSLETHAIVYRPGYHEYRNAPTTILEHSLVYDEYGDANVTVQQQAMIGTDELVVTVVDGDLEQTSTGATSVSVETLEGPATESTDENVTISIPTSASDRWVETAEDLDNARVLEANESVVTIDVDVSRVTVARVSVGEDAGDDQLEEFGDENDEPANGEGTYDVEWDTEAIDEEPGMTCSESSCTYALGQSSVNLTIGTDPLVEGASIDYALEVIDGAVGIGSLDPGDGETDGDGKNVTVLLPDGAEDGDEIRVHANAGGAGDTLTVTFESTPFFEVDIVETNSPVQEGETLEVTANVTNSGTDTDTQDVDLVIDGKEIDTWDDLELAAGASEEITLKWETEDGDAGSYNATVSSNDDSDETSVDVSDELLQYNQDSWASDVDGNSNTGLRFTVTNLGDEEVEITELLLVTITGDANTVETSVNNCNNAGDPDGPDAPVLHIDADEQNGCVADNQFYNIGEDPFDLQQGNNDLAQLSAGATGVVSIQTFFDEFGTPVNITDETIIVEITYDYDGDEHTLELETVIDSGG